MATELRQARFRIPETDIMDVQDLRPISVEQNSQLYRETAAICRQDIVIQFFQWMLEALWHGTIAYAIPLLAFRGGDRDGKTDGIDAMGLATFTCIVLIVNVKVKIISSSLTSA